MGQLILYNILVKRTKENKKMLYVLLFLVSLIFFPDITVFGVVLFSIYIGCTVLPEFVAKLKEENRTKKSFRHFRF